MQCIHIRHYPHPNTDPNPNPKSYPNFVGCRPTVRNVRYAICTTGRTGTGMAFTCLLTIGNDRLMT